MVSGPRSRRGVPLFCACLVALLLSELIALTPPANAASRASSLQFTATAGQTYYFQAGGYRSSTGSPDLGVLSVNVAAA
jgi:hypothetical protein